MVKKKITQDQLRALIEAQAAKLPGCEGLRDVCFFGTEEGSRSNWTIAFAGISPGDDANAFAAIIKRLTAEYDLAWHIVH